MNKKKTPDEIRRKARSLETMLSRERTYAHQLEIIATAATAALEKVNNGEIKEGCGIIRAAVAEARAARGAGSGAEAGA